MVASVPELRFTSAGFWLPCYRSSFFSHDADFDILRASYEFGGTNGPSGANAKPVKLDVSIFSRLLMVLPGKGYTAAYPIEPWTPIDGVDAKDPVSMLFVCNNPAALAELGHNRSIKAVSLLVDYKGFYFWTVAYTGSHVRQSDVQKALKAHIVDLVGGDYWSHYSGRPTDAKLAETLPDDNLMRYRDENRGILTFFQLNAILEGLYNANLDPRKFFRSAPEIDQRFYSVGHFIRQITATYHPFRSRQDSGHRHLDDEQVLSSDDATKGAPVADFFTAYLASTMHPHSLLMTQFVTRTDYATARAHILDQFLIRTEDITLKRLKKRVERCRRALLEGLIEVTHRRDPLIQVEPPPDDGPIDFIEEDVTEAQLRGYVMLVSAKMPLISNVLFHLEDLRYAPDPGAKRSGSSSADDIEKDSSAVYGPFHSWRTLLQALEHDVESLIEAIAQARTDRMLYEQEQIHAEQETLAEITRLQERTDNAVSPSNSLAISVISNLLALFAVALSAAAFFSQGINFAQFSHVGDLFNPKNFAAEGELVLAVAILVLLYALFQFGMQRGLRWSVRLVKHDLRRDAKYYYEMDIHVGAPLLDAALPDLIAGGLPNSNLTFRRTLSKEGIKRVERNSYRVERLERSEALHKIYVEADLRVSKRRIIHAILVYHILFHRPSREHGYVFQDLRVVATHADELSPDEIIRLKSIVVTQFVNAYLEAGWRLIPPTEQAGDPDDNYDAIYTATRIARRPKVDPGHAGIEPTPSTGEGDEMPIHAQQSEPVAIPNDQGDTVY